MTDRFNALTVVLERDIREDDAQHLIDAIRMMRGVADVNGQTSDAIATVVERSRLAREVRDKLYLLISEIS